MSILIADLVGVLDDLLAYFVPYVIWTMLA